MGTRGLEIVCFRGRYYVRYHQFDSYFEGLGAQIVARIPAEPEAYQKWLDSMRARYAATERALEERVYEIKEGSKPDCSQFYEFEMPPSELPRLDGYDAEYFYTINLDREILTMNHSIHWKLGNIPRQDNLWIRAIADSICRYKPTIDPDICSEEHMGSLALDLPEFDPEIPYNFRQVTPRTDIGGGRKAFLMLILARVLIEYKNEIVRFGRQWGPDSFPFRELSFALICIASDQAKFYSFPVQQSTPKAYTSWNYDPNRLPKSPGWSQKECATKDNAPLLEFGSMSHRPAEPPGASPTETIYWHEDVLISLVLRADGRAITNAVTWAIEQGRTANFQIVFLSLFKVVFAEVVFDDDDEPFVKVCRSLPLSPLRANYCVSTHPRERPVDKPGMKTEWHYGEDLMESNCTGTVRRLRGQFPGLAALINFFDVAANRRAASKPRTSLLPPELCCRILDYVDYDTWKSCSVVSQQFRSCCFLKYRLDDRMRIVTGPVVRLSNDDRKERMLSFQFENMQTGKILPTVYVPRNFSMKECNWMPIIGSDRKALMLEVCVQFLPAEDDPIVPDSDDEQS